MQKLFDFILDSFFFVLKISGWGFGILLVAGEIRLAALKKISQGSPKLLSFTERMTGERLRF
jgi:hypothetical protein